MKKVTYHKFKDSIVVSFKDKTITIPSGDERYSIILELIRQKRDNEIPGVADNTSKNEIKRLLRFKE